MILAVAAALVAAVYSGAQARDSARDADASRQALAAPRRASAFSEVLRLHQQVFDAYGRTSLAYAGARHGRRTASTRSRSSTRWCRWTRSRTCSRGT